MSQPSTMSLWPRGKCHDGHKAVPCPRNLGMAIGAAIAGGLIVLSLLAFLVYYLLERRRLPQTPGEEDALIDAWSAEVSWPQAALTPGR